MLQKKGGEGEVLSTSPKFPKTYHTYITYGLFLIFSGDQFEISSLGMNRFLAWTNLHKNCKSFLIEDIG